VYGFKHFSAQSAVPLKSALALSVTSGNGAAALRYGNLALQLKDALGNIMKAVVTIDRIYLSEDVVAGLPTLAERPHTPITNLWVAAKEYRQMRFAISGAYVELEVPPGRRGRLFASSATYKCLPKGASVDGVLVLPSRTSSGLCLDMPNEAVTLDADGSLVLLIDFDVALHWSPDDDAGRWHLTAGIHASVPTAA
jgi:hypothetical protein